jgi:hypothetical protein
MIRRRVPIRGLLLSIITRTRPLAAISVFDITPADDAFTTLRPTTPIDWIGLSGLPANAIERGFRLARLSRYRAAIQAAMSARGGRFLISHLPNMTAATAAAIAILRRRAPHLAFAFNFTALPTGRRLAYFRNMLRDIDQFAIFSQFERSLYAEHFGLDPDRIVPVIWTQEAPPVQAEPGLPKGQPYVCAIGGEGRDFATLLEAARRIGPALRVVVIARPHSLLGLKVPDHVEVLTNIPLARVWRIAADSAGVLVPLMSEDTCCGHITLVGAKQLGLPIATTFAHSTREYVERRDSILECAPGDPAIYARLIERLVDERERLKEAAQEARLLELELHSRRHWEAYLETFIQNHVLGAALA